MLFFTAVFWRRLFVGDQGFTGLLFADQHFAGDFPGNCYVRFSRVSGAAGDEASFFSDHRAAVQNHRRGRFGLLAFAHGLNLPPPVQRSAVAGALFSCCIFFLFFKAGRLWKKRTSGCN